jgi:hypothetical protein
MVGAAEGGPDPEATMSDPTPSPTIRMDTPSIDAAPPKDPNVPDAGAAGQPPEPPPPGTPASPAAPPTTVAPQQTGASGPAGPSDFGTPGWYPPDQGNPGRTGSIIVGLILLVVGLWFLAEVTLDLDLPPLDLGQLWPLILIVIGGWILLAGFRRGSR